MDIKKKGIKIAINPKLYSLDVVYSAAYAFLDRAYVFLDGDPQTEILVYLKAKGKFSSDSQRHDFELGLEKEFLDELINYGDYINRAKATKELREILLKRIILTNDPESFDENSLIDPVLIKEDDEELKALVDDLVSARDKNNNKNNKNNNKNYDKNDSDGGK